MSSSNSEATVGNFSADPGRIPRLAAAIRSGEFTSASLVQRYLDRIAVADPHVRCWRQVDGDRALVDARLRDGEVKAGRIRGPLHGIPVAIKDIIDVEGMQTLANCRARANIALASGDAEIVRALRNAGAIILGKVHTTEFAFFGSIARAQSAQSWSHTRWIEFGVGCGGCVRHGTACCRHADRCVGKPAGRLLRDRRIQAEHAQLADFRHHATWSVVRYTGLLRLARR